MGRTSRTAAFLRQVYGTRARVGWHGHVRRDPVALLQLGPGSEDPYPLYERIRAQGAPLARMEGEVAFGALAERLPDLRVAGRPQQRRGRTIRGPAVLPVSARSRAEV